MLYQRIISAIIGGAIFILLIHLGGEALFGAIFLLSIIGFKEYSRIINGMGYHVENIIGYISILFIALLAYLTLGNILLPILILLTIISIIYYLFKFPDIKIEGLALAYFGSFYIAWSLFHIYKIRNLPNGFWLVIFIFIIIWSTDTGAYFSGLNFGKHKLAPLISPKKTVEGFFGGIIVSLITSYLYSYFILNYKRYDIIIFITIISILGQLGDLFESSLKRQARIKDSGTIIPGHGGILDRFDSTFVTAPLAYYVLYFIFLK